MWNQRTGRSYANTGRAPYPIVLCRSTKRGAAGCGCGSAGITGTPACTIYANLCWVCWAVGATRERWVWLGWYGVLPWFFSHILWGVFQTVEEEKINQRFGIVRYMSLAYPIVKLCFTLGSVAHRECCNSWSSNSLRMDCSLRGICRWPVHWSSDPGWPKHSGSRSAQKWGWPRGRWSQWSQSKPELGSRGNKMKPPIVYLYLNNYILRPWPSG